MFVEVVTEYLSNHLLYVGAFGLSVVAVQAVAIIIAVLILTFTDYSAVKHFFYLNSLNSYSHCNNRAERKSREEIKHTIVNSE